MSSPCSTDFFDDRYNSKALIEKKQIITIFKKLSNTSHYISETLYDNQLQYSAKFFKIVSTRMFLKMSSRYLTKKNIFLHLMLTCGIHCITSQDDNCYMKKIFRSHNIAELRKSLEFPRMTPRNRKSVYNATLKYKLATSGV